MTTALDLNNPRSSCEIRKVRAVEFSIFSPEHLIKMSVCEVKSLELYENGFPKEGGLNDPRMGTTDYRIPCASCNMDCKQCPGHFGHIALAKPMYHIGYLRVVLSTLRCVCYSCSRILVDLNEVKAKVAARTKNPKARFYRILDLCQNKKRCEASSLEDEDAGRDGGCGCIQPKYSKDGISLTIQMQNEHDIFYGGGDNDTASKGAVVTASSGEDSKRPLPAEEALAILQRISDHDVRLLGFDPNRNHPAWMIMSVLPVPPPQVRPYVQYGSDRSEDDMTLKLLDIVKTNQQLKRHEEAGAAGHILQEVGYVLQYHIATLINNDIPGLPVATTRAKKPIKSLRQRLKGKDGRLRGNLMGKRVDFSARTVITGDPNLSIDQVGVPKSVAMNLTFPETVTAFNIEELKKLVANGPFEWPGARYIIRSDGTRFDLRHCQGNPAAQQLEIGDRVERHMKDDDYVLFNRQPSLHKMSIMGHRTKILPWSTFRLNLSVTSPYNADFDGDEMNLHLPQSHETRAEIKHLMLVPKQIVSPQGNKPVMGIVQDSLLGIAKFTKRDTFLTRAEVMNLLVWIPYWDGQLPCPAILKPQPLWTGKQMITRLLSFDPLEGSNQAKINLTRDGTVRHKNDSEWCSENDGRVIIRNNEHLAGIICKRTAGSSSGSLIHTLWLEVGPERTKQFLSVSQRVVNMWLEHYGFTVGCADIVAPEGASVKVLETLRESAGKVKELVAAAQKGLLETQPGKSLLQSFESRVNQELNRAREAAGKIAADSLDERNNIIAMVNAGSKGSTINISQIMACVGQQNVEGRRIPFGFKDRSLPHFVKHDYGPESRGFVFNSYLTGLTPQELFFHAMGGREGIIDTACKTSETGYIQRRLIKAMEDVLVSYDRTVRSCGGDIVQFLYGEDGMAGEYVEDLFLPLMKMDHESMAAAFKHDFTSHDYGRTWIPNEAIRNNIRLSFQQQSVLEHEWQQLVTAKRRLCSEIFTDGEAKQHLPINVARLIEFAQNRFPNESLDTVSPVDIARQVEDLLTTLTVIIPTGDNDYISKEVQSNSTTLLHIHLRAALNSRKLMECDRLGPQGLQWLFGEITHQFHRALAHPGEVVGAMAAQSIGEPATQMTLNTFHFAGVGSKNITLGVPRLKELINVSKTVKTPSLTVYLKPNIARDQDAAKSVQSHLEHTTLEKVTSYAQIVYDPNPTDTIIEADKQWVSEYYEFPDDEDLPSKLGPWVLRIQLIERFITDKQLTMKEIGEKICAEFSSDEIDCIWTDDNSEDLVIRIRIKFQDANKDRQGGSGGDDADDSEDENRFLQRLMSQYLSNITLRGIHGITKVYMREEKSQIYDPVTGSFKPSSQWVLDTDGCNLAAVLCVEEVDATRTISNDIVEVFEVLGIEAVRRALLREMRAVISFDGSYVNYRHLATLCDVMTQKGHLMSITRNGINRVDKGCLSKCSFEETVEILMMAAAFAETDHLRGVTEHVMFGQLAPFGTGLCDLVIDEAKLKQTNPNYDTSYTSVMGSIHGQQQQSVTGLEDVTSPFSDGGGCPLIVSPNTMTQSLLQHQQQPARDFAATPFSPTSPMSPMGASSGRQFTSPPPQHDPLHLGGQFSPIQQSPRSPTSPMSPYSPQAMTPVASPLGGMFSPTTAAGTFCPSPTSNAYSITSPQYSPTSPVYSATSPAAYTPGVAGTRDSLQCYSVTSPTYSPTSPLVATGNLHTAGGHYSPTSPTYSPTSPVVISPTSPVAHLGLGARGVLSPTSPHYGKLAQSPEYSPRSPSFLPTSPMTIQSPGAYSLTSPNYSPTSPSYALNDSSQGIPLSPDMSIASPRYDPHHSGPYQMSPSYSPSSPMYSPTSPVLSHIEHDTATRYSPTSPNADNVVDTSTCSANDVSTTMTLEDS